ncbi:hypothetical protein [Natrinema pallidum]|uniref:Uncharacterized protein n=1 Tax=Natrinema pallidum DSM 3751 TaxID=1227495 RepID=L9Z5I7_9EURY|nr:hypothetical protein [Natrinema pallidum]ELY81171.1 hypothetical protein C487_03723 [Natrinema pallidum DSM 3751]
MLSQSVISSHTALVSNAKYRTRRPDAGAVAYIFEDIDASMRIMEQLDFHAGRDGLGSALLGQWPDSEAERYRPVAA